MRVCICISGQVRGEMKALRHFSEEIKKMPNRVDVTVIFSLWRNSGRKLTGALGFSQLNRIFNPDVAKIIPPSYYGVDFWDYFPQAYESISRYTAQDIGKEIEALFPESIIDIEDEIMDLEFSTPKKDKNSIKMLYKRWRCNEIKKKLEREGGKFHVVLVSRPDLFIEFAPERLEETREGFVFLPNAGRRQNYTNDLMAYGSTDSIDKYSSLFHKAISLNEWNGIHGELNKYLCSVGVEEKDADLFETKGLESDTLVDSEILIKDDAFLASLYENDFDLNSLSSDQLISVYTKKFLEVKDKKLEASVRYFVLADFSRREIRDYRYDRDKYVYDEFLELALKANIYSFEDLSNFVPDLEFNSQAIKNISGFFESQKAETLRTARKVKRAIKSKEYESLMDIASCKGLPDYFADYLRDIAVYFEPKDLLSAHHVMSLALEVRPGGPFIKKKVDEYKNKIRSALVVMVCGLWFVVCGLWVRG